MFNTSPLSLYNIYTYIIYNTVSCADTYIWLITKKKKKKEKKPPVTIILIAGGDKYFHRSTGRFLYASHRDRHVMGTRAR